MQQRKTSQENTSVLCSRKFPVEKKCLYKRTGGKYQNFSSKFFLSHCAAKLRRGILRCFINLRYRSIFWLKGLSQVFSSILFFSQYRIFSQGNHLCFTNNLVSENFMDQMGGAGSVTILRQNFFVSQCRKICHGNPFLCLISGVENFQG